MTNTPTIDGVSRELLETLVKPIRSALDESKRLDARKELRALLDAPVVERQPVAWMYLERSEDGYEYRPLFSHQKWVVLPDGFYEESPLYTAPPELAALQSTIAQLQGRIAELESARGEPTIDHVASLVEGKTVSVDVSTGDHDAGNRLFCQIVEVMEDGDSYVLLAVDPVANFEVTPPAPVAVVLPERMKYDGTSGGMWEADIWNACLDATAALNTVHVGELDPAERLALARGWTFIHANKSAKGQGVCYAFPPGERRV